MKWVRFLPDLIELSDKGLPKEKICLIAGVGPGTGTACVKKFSNNGYKVVMIARNIDFINNSSDTVFNLPDWQWTINNTLFSISENPPTFISDDNEQEFEIELIITNEKGCLDTTTQIIDIGIDLEYSNSISTCEPVTTFNLDVNVLENPDITSWVWEPTAGIISGGNTNTPSVDLTIASTYYFSVVYADGCVFEDSIEIDHLWNEYYACITLLKNIRKVITLLPKLNPVPQVL